MSVSPETAASPKKPSAETSVPMAITLADLAACLRRLAFSPLVHEGTRP